jgi:hypothetical protein
MTRTKIGELTPGQWQTVHQRRAEWLGRGLCTAPADRPATEQIITAMYGLIREKSPEYMWVDGPLSALMAQVVAIRKHPSRHPALNSSLRAAVRRSLDIQLADSLAPSLHDHLRNSLDAPLSASLGTSLVNPVYHSLWQLTTGSVGNSVLRDVCFWGQYEWWLAGYLVPHELGIVTYKPDDAAKLHQWAQLALSTGWWWPCKKLCIVSERPSEVHTEIWDASLGTVRLHNATGPAIQYRDGWKVHAWHGRLVPAWVIEEPTADRIAAEPDAEVRQCAIEVAGLKGA